MIKMTRSEKVFNVFNMTFMVLFSIACFYPFIYIAALSFNDASDAMRGGIYVLPRQWSLANYAAIFREERIVTAAMISVYRTVATTVFAVFLNSCFAFALTKRDLPGRKFFNWFVVIPLYFGGGLIPYFLLIRSLNLLNNLLVYVLPSIIGCFIIMMMRAYYSEMPIELEESAKIDGAGYFTIFFKIYFPLSMPCIATVALLTGIGQWNDWITGSVMMFDTSKWPLQTLLLDIIKRADISDILRQAGGRGAAAGAAARAKVTTESVKMAMLVITVLPIVAIYPFFQKHFVKGLMIGAIKS